MIDRRSLWRLVALVVLAAAGAAVAVAVGVPSLAHVRGQVAGWGSWAGVVFAAVYGVATLSPLPKSVFTLAAGAVFGLAEGLAVVLVGACVGAVAAFYLARIVGADAVHRLTGLRADRVDDLLARRGLWAIVVARLIPVVPFTAVNYLAGLTAMSARGFIGGTALGILPATTAYVALGAYGSRPGWWPFWSASAALVAVSLIGLAAARRLKRSTRPAQP